MIRRRRTTGRHDTDAPDAAALDELRRAFGAGDPPGSPAKPAESERTQDEPSDDEPSDEPSNAEPSDDERAGSPVDPDATPVEIATDVSVDDMVVAIEASEGSNDPAEPDDADPDAGVGDRRRDDRPGGVDPLLGTGREPSVDDDAGPPAVITITDEDLPDAVYVEGDLDPGRGRGDVSVVIIDDGDLDDPQSPAEAASATRSAIEPRFRDRRIAVRRAAGRRRLRWFVVVGVVVVLVIGALAVLGSPLFSIDQVSVTGAVYTDADELGAVVEDLEGTPTLIADTDAAEQRLRAIPWVADARVRTQFPSSASIEIRERVPLATFRGPDGRFRVIDREARVLDVIDGQPVAYVLITSADSVNLQPGQFATPGFAAAAELSQALTPTVRGRVRSVEVRGDASDLRMLLDDGMEVRFGAATDLLVKLVRLETVLPIAIDRDARVVDVSTGEVSLGR